MTHEQASNHFVPVKISDGMFSNEYAIELRLKNGTVVTFFANKSLIKDVNDQPKLKVYLYEIHQDSELVLLPTETFETASRWAELPLQKSA